MMDRLQLTEIRLAKLIVRIAQPSGPKNVKFPRDDEVVKAQKPRCELDSQCFVRCVSILPIKVSWVFRQKHYKS